MLFIIVLHVIYNIILLSLSPDSVCANTYVPIWALTEQQAVALSAGVRPFRSVSNTFIFSTRQQSAVSVASPTFSNTPLLCVFQRDRRNTEKIKSLQLHDNIKRVRTRAHVHKHLIVIQRRVITQGTDRGHFHQPFILTAAYRYTVLIPETERRGWKELVKDSMI